MSKRLTVASWPARKNRDYNPFQWLLAQALEQEGVTVVEFNAARSFLDEVDLWHWHWPDGAFAGKRGVALARYVAMRLLLLVAQARRIPIVWTVHNVGAHEASWRTLEAKFMIAFTRSVSGLHYLSGSSQEEAEQRFPVLRGRPSVRTRHGDYSGVARRRDPESARRYFGLRPEGLVVAFVGTISPYKGVVELVDAYVGAGISDTVELLVAGQPNPALRDWCGNLESIDGVTVAPRLLSQDELDMAYSAADLVVLPYREVTNSGSAIMALTLGVPVLLPDSCLSSEMASDVPSGCITTYPGPLTPSVLKAALLPRNGQPGSRGAKCLSQEKFAWSVVARALLPLYRGLAR